MRCCTPLFFATQFQNSVPVELSVSEEISLGTVIGRISAVDADSGENSVIEYAIVDGNDNKIFQIEADDNSVGVIRVAR